MLRPDRREEIVCIIAGMIFAQRRGEVDDDGIDFAVENAAEIVETVSANTPAIFEKFLNDRIASTKE